MAKTGKLLVFGLVLFSLALSLTFVSADSVVSGKIYNSDFSEVIGGATVSVECNSETETSTSENDGTYAVSFNSEVCSLGSEVSVSASKGDLLGEGSADIEESDEGELVTVINVNIEEEEEETTTTTSSSSRRYSGTWFKCGNTVCESDETYDSCPADCPPPVKEEPIELITLTENTAGETNTQETTTPGITGAVVGDNLRNKNTLPITLGAVILLLIVGILGIAVARSTEPRKVDSGIPHGNASKYY